MTLLFSCIQPKTKKTLLKRACSLAFPGFFLLFYMGIYFKIEQLQKWGWIGFGIGFTLIACGMIPLRRISSLESKPHRLILEKSSVQFIHSRKGRVEIPYASIEKMSFVDKKAVYGIRLHLKGGRYFFLPYFSRRTYDIMQMDEADEPFII